MFSRTGERASGMLLLTNQFHNSFEYLSLIGLKKYFCAQSEASIHRAAFVIFLYEASFFRGSGPNKLSALYLQGECDTYNSFEKTIALVKSFIVSF